MGNMDTVGEVLCHIPNSNVSANFLSENKPCHIYGNDEILKQPFQFFPDSKRFLLYFYEIHDKKMAVDKLQNLQKKIKNKILI
jgi:hypothetical protein